MSAIHCDTITPVSFQDIAKVQSDDSELSQLQTSNTSLKLQATPIPTSEETIICDISTGVPRPLFQPNSAVIYSIHYILCLILALEPLNA